MTSLPAALVSNACVRHAELPVVAKDHVHLDDQGQRYCLSLLKVAKRVGGEGPQHKKENVFLGTATNVN